MDNGNVDTWCNCMYESCTLIVKKVAQCVAHFNNFNLVAHYNYNVTF